MLDLGFRGAACPVWGPAVPSGPSLSCPLSLNVKWGPAHPHARTPGPDPAQLCLPSLPPMAFTSFPSAHLGRAIYH